MGTAIGQTVTISYTAKGYAVKVSYKKGKKTHTVTKYYSDLSLLLKSPGVTASVTSKGNLMQLTANKTKISSKESATPLANIHNTTQPYSDITLYHYNLPGYQNAYLEFVNINTKKSKVCGFMVSPNSISISYSSARNLVKTIGGWVSFRAGDNLTQINFSGYMIDSLQCQERHNFIENYYQKIIRDQKNGDNEYVGEWNVNLIIEGRKYFGFFQSLTFQKAAIQPFLYQYNISFVSSSEKLMYHSANAKSHKRNPYALAELTNANKESAAAITSVIGNKTAELLTK